MVRVQLRRLSLVGDHAVTLIHYEGRLSDTVLSVYADSCLVSVFVVADAGELFIYTTYNPSNSVVYPFCGVGHWLVLYTARHRL